RGEPRAGAASREIKALDRAAPPPAGMGRGMGEGRGGEGEGRGRSRRRRTRKSRGRERRRALRLRHGARARCPIGARPSPRPSCTAPAAGEPGGRPCLAVPPLDTSVPEASVGGGERGGDVRRRRHSQKSRKSPG
ncbi:unnamed protein product, partial [Prorocentrum cordatum]